MLLLLLTTQSYAFLYEVKILTPSEITNLSNDQILEVFKSAVIERKASEAFHGRAGFSPKEYEKYKELLGLIIDIREEMAKREMNVPPLEEWLR